jgi:uncharacterized protein YoaH (UPF0181 family)
MVSETPTARSFRAAEWRAKDPMAANFVIDEGQAWKPPGWVYNHVVSHLATRFMSSDQELSDRFERSLGPANPFFDFRQLSSKQQFETIAEIQKLMKKVLQSGESVMTDPSFLEQLRGELRELVNLVSVSCPV